MTKYFAVAAMVAGAAWAASAPPQVTFHKDVEPILQKHCQECHRPGEIAPFSLLSYKDARPWAKAIRADVLTKKMPPWFADPRYGHFVNDRSLSPDEVSTLVSWVDSGVKEGDLKDAPKALAFVDGWNIQKPDVVLGMSESFHLPAKGDIPYQYVVLPTQFTEDKWVQMAEARPSDRSVVHHVVIFIRDPQSKWLREAKTNVPFVPEGGNFQNISGGGNDILFIYTPGKVPEIWRPGLGKMIKAGSDLVLQIHYTTNGKEAEDHTKVGLVFAKEKPTERALTIGGNNLGFKIPPGDPNYRVEASNVFPNGATILNFFPHMHLRGKSFEYSVVYPDGRSEVVLRVPQYDFFWQLDYQLAKPLTIPPGAKIVCTAWYDNSPNNPKNPDPTATVRFGEQSWEEMMIGFYDVVIPADASVRDLFAPPPQKTGGAPSASLQ
ncbi:MAG TPA: thiol-disulfide isomerase [Bryobacteraceae bacterium]|nr:thiol-disulfide isomerase [Bryobacteraceae bacterium]